MEAYKRMIEKIINNTPITNEDIFDYEFSPLKDEFDFNFEFYHEALRRNEEYGISSSLLFYSNEFSPNAAAGRVNGYYIIQINLGLMRHLIEHFKNKTDLLIGTENDEFIDFEESINLPINELMYQNALHFTFYHEMAHLIQNSELLINKLYEQTEGDGEYSELKHLLELDADKYSSLCIGAHVLGFLDTNFGSNLTREQLEKTLIIICSSALFYMLSFQTNKKDIYYKETTHPHPVIRITCIILNIVEYIRQSLLKKGYSFEISTNEVVFKCIEFSNKLSIHKFESNLIEDYRIILVSEARNIAEYIKEFRIYEENDISLASYKWNIKAKTASIKNRKTNKGTKRTNRELVDRWQKRKRSKRTRIKRKRK